METTICKSWEKQVLENTNKIKELKTDVNELKADVEELKNAEPGGGGGGAGSGKYLHVIKFTINTEPYQYGQLMLLLNTDTNFTGTDSENTPSYDQFWDLGLAMEDAGYKVACVLVHEDSIAHAFTSLSFRADSSGENYLMVDTSDGEALTFDRFFNFIDTVIPL